MEADVMRKSAVARLRVELFELKMRLSKFLVRQSGDR